MEDNLKPIPISELLDKQFFIPHYQRGYRWTNQQVEQLLDDIDSFSPKEIEGKPNDKTFYCLQPVAVKALDDETKQKNNLTGEWLEVIDGQQRLTTIYLIIQYINDLWTGRQKKNQFKLNYEIRENCVQFLKDIRVNDDQETVDIVKANIDYYYISTAYKSILNWELNYLQKKGNAFDNAGFQSKFFTYSKVIWYQVSPQEKSQNLFERLNLGKIPLTNAELTKALFLSSESFKDLPQEERKIKQFEIARLWDEIEHKLNEPDLKFWSFVTNNKRENYETKIELILDLISGKAPDEKDPFFTFLKFTEKQQKGSLSKVWEEIEQFYYTVLEWYVNKDFYHKIGYLVAARTFVDYNGISLGLLVKDSMTKTKKDFVSQIDGMIKDSVKVELSELRYEKHYNQIFNVLLLFNVEINRTTDSISEYYPFKQHKGKQWSLEHIHARKSDFFDQNKREPWLKWLSLHLTVLEEMKEANNKEEKIDLIDTVIQDIKKYNNEQLQWERFSELFKDVNNLFTLNPETLDRDSEGIANLALLGLLDNSALNNSVFEIKRREIMRLDMEGSFIPVATRRVFMKYYNGDNLNTQYFYWSDSDREKYFTRIKEDLGEYLPNNFIEIEANENE